MTPHRESRFRTSMTLWAVTEVHKTSALLHRTVAKPRRINDLHQKMRTGVRNSRQFAHTGLCVGSTNDRI